MDPHHNLRVGERRWPSVGRKKTSAERSPPPSLCAVGGIFKETRNESQQIRVDSTRSVTDGPGPRSRSCGGHLVPDRLDEHGPPRPHGHAAARRPGARQRRSRAAQRPGQRGDLRSGAGHLVADWLDEHSRDSATRPLCCQTAGFSSAAAPATAATWPARRSTIRRWAPGRLPAP